MSKKILSTLMLVSLVLGLTFSSTINAMASESSVKKTGESYLTSDDYSEDRTESGIITRGEHMMDGMSSISKAGVGRIYVYASTTANHTVDYLTTMVYVDRYNEKDDAWDQIDFWQVEKENDYYVSTSKSIRVTPGYYYRVHADHICGMMGTPFEEETTITDGIFID